ncbi:septation protein SepH [Nocardioides marmoraquaticus]
MPAGLTEDGTCLLLVTASGERFVLPIDDQLQRLVGTSRHPGTPARRAPELAPTPAPAAPTPAAAAAPVTDPRPAGRTRPQKQETTMESALRPRDIQARIRGGESAETVAAAAGTSVEAIMPFAGPVLAERAHQAQTAQRASLRRGGGPGGARTLGEAVAAFLSGHGLHDDDVAWDSWRRPDGRWALTAEVEADGRTHQAQFLHDVAGRYVVAENDDARLLTGELDPPAPAGPSSPGRRLSAVAGPETTYAPGSPDHLGDDAIALVRDPSEPPLLDGPARPEPAATVSEPEPVAAEGAEPEPVAVEEPEPVAVEEAEPEPEPVAEPAAEPVAEPGDDEDGEQSELDLGVPADDKPKRARRGRSSVPSWDEIMFGGGPEKG